MNSITKKLTCYLIAFFSSTFLIGQIQSEIKLNTFGFFKGEFRPSYELILPKNIGLEIETSFESEKRSSNTLGFAFIMGPRDAFEYQHNRFEITLAGKYYFKKSKIGEGFFAGVYTGLNFITKSDEDFTSNYEMLFNRAAPEYLYGNGLKHIFVGATGGYKYLIKEKVVIELNMIYVNQNFIGAAFSGLDLDIVWFLKFGYRL